MMSPRVKTLWRVPASELDALAAIGTIAMENRSVVPLVDGYGSRDSLENGGRRRSVKPSAET